MGKIRVIITSTVNGDQEEVFFTSDLESSVNDFCRPNFQVDSDTIIADNLPSGFPREYTLVRNY